MPRCYMVKKQSNKYQGNGNREFWDGAATSTAAPESPAEACVAPYYNPASTQPSYLQDFAPNGNSSETANLSVKKETPVTTNSHLEIFRTRSIEETEAAHDLLSLSQSLPPLPAPGAVTYHHTIPKEEESPPPLTYSYSPLSPESVTNSPVSIPIPCYQSPILYVVQVPTVPTPPTSECSSDAENQLQPLCINDTVIKQGSTFSIQNLSEKPEEIFILPLSPEPERPQDSAGVVSVIRNDEEAAKKKTAFAAASLSIPDRRMRKNSRNCKNNKSVRNSNKDSDQNIAVNKKNKTKFYTVIDEDEDQKQPPTESSPPEADPSTKSNRYICCECGKQYATSSNLSRHKQTHRSLDSQSAKKCMTCGKAYVSMPALAMHVLTHKLAHSCGVCGKQFSRPWLLQGHLRSHSGEKPYGCAHCGKAFADRSNLRAHMQTHSADKNFRCTNCKKTFALKSYLNKHQESACQVWDYDKDEREGENLGGDVDVVGDSADNVDIDV